MEIIGKLVLKLCTPNAFSAGTITLGITALDHKVVDNPVEGKTVVIAILGMGNEVFYRFRSLILEEADGNVAHIGFNDGNFLTRLGLLKLFELDRISWGKLWSLSL